MIGQHNAIDLNIFLAAPPPPVPNCTIVATSGSPEVTLKWSTSFNSRYGVGRYRVVVTGSSSTCSSDQVSPNEEYSCSGLGLGMDYSIRFNAINCGGQEGESNTHSIQLRGETHDYITWWKLFCIHFLCIIVPEIPTNIKVTTEGDFRVEWTKMVSYSGFYTSPSIHHTF